ncbi:hypothetical protein [Sporosarcina limicola]|uniref:Sporulation protein Cse60 n=1 Tax=Sporosarcina limicola TaxID=34101 RepID=A0A927MTA9_9BACL|nr:hypothetical protein [Sporosarcina limicola]MBE1557004.1 hypothetical protein [Sporosarcina limicola]
MNKFEIIIEEFDSQYEANKGVNEFIRDCADTNIEVLEITSHMTAIGKNITYVFIYKVALK